jgi:hypothetical protein
MHDDFIFPAAYEQNKNNKQSHLKPNNDLRAQQRKTRFDKTESMKFPVTPGENAQFRHLWLVYRPHFKVNSITVFLTQLLRYGLRHPEIIKHDIEYSNSSILKTVNPNQCEKDMICGINGLTIQWQLTSNRKTLHRIMISVLHYLRNGGTLNYEEVQQIRPY